MLESSVEDHLTRKVVEAGGEVRKVQWPGRRHAPDRLVLFKRVQWHGLVELKRPGEEPREGQVREHKRLRDAGFQVFVIDTKEQVDRFVAKYSKPIVNTQRGRVQ